MGQMYIFVTFVGTLALSIAVSRASMAGPVLAPTPLLTTAAEPNHSRYDRSAGIYSGVGNLLLNQENLTVGCTGVLLGTGRNVLTAAHCVTDGDLPALLSGQVTFPSSSGAEETIAISRVDVNPAWTGDLRAGGDLAVLTLQHAASSAIRRYNLYSGSSEVGSVVELVGFGLSGTGADGTTIDDGKRRGGFNRLDGTFVKTIDSLPGWTAGANAFLIDFDDGSIAHDALSVFGLVDRGTGLGEVFPTSGDSGGPAFLNGSIAATMSFRTRVSRPDGTTPDIDSERNSSFGEIAGLTRISSYADWITAVATPVPEPATLILMGLALALMVARISLKTP